MKQPKSKTIQPSPWGEEAVTQEETQSSPLTSTIELEPPVYEALDPIPDLTYDFEGLMSDFPTATELQKFVYDQTNIALNLKGRANKLKYQIALDVLNGKHVDPKFITGENPYVDKNDMVPSEPMRGVPERDKSLPDISTVQNTFWFRGLPHPDTDYRSMDKKVDTMFRKYDNGMISYEILGPLEPKAIGEKMDKFGKMRPELMTWVDPRTGEQLIVRTDGSVTPKGQRIRAFMMSQKVNNSSMWEIFIDREFASINQATLDNPWAA